MRSWMSVIHGHPVIAATRALRFSGHVTKRNGGSGDENVKWSVKLRSCAEVSRAMKILQFEDTLFVSNLEVNIA